MGEAAILAFRHHQTGNIGVGMIATVAWFKLGRVTDRSVGARRAILEARLLAKQAAWFVEVPWHRWLARPIDEVRRDLGVRRTARYHPLRSHEVDVRLVA